MLSEPIRITLQVIQAFNQLEIPYLIGGSIASVMHGVPRATMDVDIVADVKTDNVNSLVSLLNNSFYIDPDMIRNAILHRSSFNLIHLETMFKVDIFISKHRPFDQTQMQRRVIRFFDEEKQEKAYFSSAEDIILAKLEWFRNGEMVSDRQWRDVLGVLRTQADMIDINYLKKWAKIMGLEELLEKALNEGK